jgi:hypothetical protein
MRNLAIVLTTLVLSGCLEVDDNTSRDQQAHKAAEAANSVRFSDNAEIDNIKRRLELTGDPGKLGFILLLNQAGQPILYEGVKGKITSGGKRLTRPYAISSGRVGTCDGGCGQNNVVVSAPSDEGTWGQSSEYIYYWNTDGVYRQWAGDYLYSDQPIRLRVEPLVVSIQTSSK